MTTSVLRNLLRTSSISPRASDEPNSPSLKASPSFSDFSLGVGNETDACSGATETKSPACTPHTPSSYDRRSFDSVYSQGSIGSFLGRRSLDLLFGPKNDSGPTTENVLHNSPSVPIPVLHKHAKHSRPVATPDQTPRQKARKQKIDGMEFYEWAELIRSSSL